MRDTTSYSAVVWDADVSKLLDVLITYIHWYVTPCKKFTIHRQIFLPVIDGVLVTAFRVLYERDSGCSFGSISSIILELAWMIDDIGIKFFAAIGYVKS